MRAVALQYALAPACVLLAVLLHLSPAGATLHPTGLFAIAVLAAAWFGGAGPGFLAAVLATFTLPQLIAMSYPLLGGFLDVPRFITFSVAGLVVGWWGFRRRQVEAALRESEERYQRVVAAAEAGFWDWDVVQDKYYVSPRLLEMAELPRDTIIAGRADFQARVPLHSDDLAKWQQATQALFASGGSRLSTELRVILSSGTRSLPFRRDVLPRRGGQRRALDGLGDRRHAAQARRAGAARIGTALRASHGCERVGILGLGRLDRPLFCLGESE